MIELLLASLAWSLFAFFAVVGLVVVMAHLRLHRMRSRWDKQ